MRTLWLLLCFVFLACSQSSLPSYDSGTDDFETSSDDALSETYEAQSPDEWIFTENLADQDQPGTDEFLPNADSDQPLFATVSSFAKLLEGTWINQDKRIQFTNVGEVFKDGWGVEYWTSGSDNRYCFAYRSNPEGYHLWQDYQNVEEGACTNDNQPYLDDYSEETHACSDGQKLSLDCFIDDNPQGDDFSLVGTWSGFVYFGTSLNWEQHAYTLSLSPTGKFDLTDHHTMEPFQYVVTIYSGDWTFDGKKLNLSCTASDPIQDPLYCPYRGDFWPLLVKQQGIRTLGWKPIWQKE